MKAKYCEFPGTQDHVWDEVGYVGKCDHVGGKKCVKYKERLPIDTEGWRMCSPSCTTPYVELNKGG